MTASACCCSVIWPKFLHAPQHVLLALARALRIRNRVVGGRRFWQAGEHGGLREAQLVERLAEVDLRGGGETVGALPEVDLVDVELEDLVLAQVVLDLEREQRLVELARQRLLGGEEEIARHLHGDRARALAAAALREVGVGGARDAQIVDAGVLVEALVLGREDRLLQLLGHLLDRNQQAALFAELADQRALRRCRPAGGSWADSRSVPQAKAGSGRRARRPARPETRRPPPGPPTGPAETPKNEATSRGLRQLWGIVARRPGTRRIIDFPLRGRFTRHWG